MPFTLPSGAYSSKSNANYGPQHGMKLGGGQKVDQFAKFTPEQMQLFQQMFGQVGPDSFLSRLAGGDQSMFDEMEQPAIKQFGALQSGLASKFSGMGMGGRKSSGFGLESNAAAQDFASQLQSQRLGLRNQAIKDLMGMSSDLLSQDPYHTMVRERTHHGANKKGSGWGGSIGAGIGGLGGFFAGGPAGAFKGASMGYGIGSSF